MNDVFATETPTAPTPTISGQELNDDSDEIVVVPQHSRKESTTNVGVAFPFWVGIILGCVLLVALLVVALLLLRRRRRRKSSSESHHHTTTDISRQVSTESGASRRDLLPPPDSPPAYTSDHSNVYSNAHAISKTPIGAAAAVREENIYANPAFSTHSSDDGMSSVSTHRDYVSKTSVVEERTRHDSGSRTIEKPALPAPAIKPNRASKRPPAKLPPPGEHLYDNSQDDTTKASSAIYSNVNVKSRSAAAAKQDSPPPARFDNLTYTSDDFRKTVLNKPPSTRSPLPSVSQAVADDAAADVKPKKYASAHRAAANRAVPVDDNSTSYKAPIYSKIHKPRVRNTSTRSDEVMLLNGDGTPPRGSVSSLKAAFESSSPPPSPSFDTASEAPTYASIGGDTLKANSLTRFQADNSKNELASKRSDVIGELKSKAASAKK